jgi:rhodanese-related sulfurtransferase
MLKKLCILMVVMLAGCIGEQQEPTLRVINVLDTALYNDAHIKGSIQVSMSDVENVAASWNRSVPVVVYCSNYFCTASGDVAKQLQTMGFEEVYAYEGGTAEWYQQGLPIEGPANESYLKIEIPAPEEESTLNISAERLQKMMKNANLLST